jgi:hypothetical protein
MTAVLTTDRFAALRALQDADGCFPSWVVLAGGREPDHNGYVTAIVLRTLRHQPGSADLAAIVEPALDWIAGCGSPRLPGAFAFWPEHARPRWAAGVPADVDDTAVILAELLRHGRVTRADALHSVCTVLLPCRLAGGGGTVLPPWVTLGSFLTWVVADARPGARRTPNPIDACVNANVVALLVLLDATHLPGYDAAVRTVRRGVDWAGADPRRLSALTPFYPAPRSLAEAVAHAVECGAEDLRPAADRLAALPAAVLDVDGGSCRSAYGRTTWQAPALDVARALAAQNWS